MVKNITKNKTTTVLKMCTQKYERHHMEQAMLKPGLTKLINL